MDRNPPRLSRHLSVVHMARENATAMGAHVFVPNNASNQQARLALAVVRGGFYGSWVSLLAQCHAGWKRVGCATAMLMRSAQDSGSGSVCKSVRALMMLHLLSQRLEHKWAISHPQLESPGPSRNPPCTLRRWASLGTLLDLRNSLCWHRLW